MKDFYQSRSNLLRAQEIYPISIHVACQNKKLHDRLSTGPFKICLLAASCSESSDHFQDCERLMLRNSEGDEWAFKGAQEAIDGTVHVNSMLTGPHAIGTGVFSH